MKKLSAVLICAILSFSAVFVSSAQDMQIIDDAELSAQAVQEEDQAETQPQDDEVLPEQQVVIMPSGEPVEGMNVSSFSSNNADSSRPQDSGNIYVGYAVTDGVLDEANSNWTGDPENIFLEGEVKGTGFTAVRAEGPGQINITGSLNVSDESDGQTASDFTGTGSALTGFDGPVLNVSNMDFVSSGFCRAFAVVQNASLLISDSNIVTYGKDPLTGAWNGYYNSANTSMMISAPWILGIQGGVRSVNILGAGSSFVLADSVITSGGWGCVSTDGCDTPFLYLYNSVLNILPASEGGMDSGWKILGYDEQAYGSGFGSYITGNAQGHFYSASVNGAAYGSILAGGDASYQGLKAGRSYPAFSETGEIIYQYAANEDVPLVINSVFGFMANGSGSVNVMEGTQVNSADASFLYKSGDVVWNVEGAQLNPANGIILQMIDNDQTTVGGFNPFGTYLIETKGFPTQAYTDSIGYIFTLDTVIDPEKTYYTADTQDQENGGFVEVDVPVESDLPLYYEKVTGGNLAELNLSNGLYEGNIYNATGYYSQAADGLKVKIAEDAVLDGDIALTSHVHGIMLSGRDPKEVISAIEQANESHKSVGGYYADTEDIEYVLFNSRCEVTEDTEEAAALQFTKFSTLEYYLMGHVINLINYNGLASIDVDAAGEWKISSASLITYLEVEEGAHVYGEMIELADGSILIIPSEKTIGPGSYGTPFVYVAAPEYVAESTGN